MANYRDRIIQLGKETQARLVLPEMEDKRVNQAVDELRSMGFNILNTEDFQQRRDRYLELLTSQPFSENWPFKTLSSYLDEPLNYGMAMTAFGDADGLVAGAVTSSSEVIRTAIRIVGIKPESKWVSSVFFMVSPNEDKAFTFADCGVIPEPTAEQLAVIAGDSAEFHNLLTGEESKVAFLSFSTKGSASHYRVDRVADAVKYFAKKYPQYQFDGELQLDAAIIPEVAAMKAPESALEGNANVLIFPNLDAGNIAYKAVQRLGAYSAWGPLLQGLNKPVHDLSRGCSVEDVINVSAVAALQRRIYADV